MRVNKEVAKELQKKNIKEFKRTKIYARFNPNLGGEVAIPTVGFPLITQKR